MHVGGVKCSEKLTTKASAGFAVRLFGSLRSPSFGGFAPLRSAPMQRGLTDGLCMVACIETGTEQWHGN
jgi:hypothetical protein